MVISTLLKTVSPFIPVIGSSYGFVKTCVRVGNATSPTKAIIAGVRGIVIDCTPPVIKYPLLCAAAVACAGGACITGDPNFAVGAFECCSAIVEG